ncbi:MAG: dihydroorotase [Thermoanaerobaculia bacterium]|nr:dihydroorotase [Thermoanaerobaculia bacterium]
MIDNELLPFDHLIRGGRVVDPSQDLDAVRDVLIRNGKIGAIGESVNVSDLELSPDQITDAEGLVVVPGLIDGRVYFGEPGHEHRETIQSGLSAAAAGGFTSVIHWGWTTPANDHRAMTQSLLAAAEQAGTARLHPVGCLSRGGCGEELAELGELAEAGCVAFADGGRPQTNAALLRRALLYALHFGVPVASRAVDPQLVGEAVVHEGAWSTRLGLAGVSATAEEVVVARDLLLVAETGGRYHLAPASLGGSAARVRRAKDAGLAVTCDVPISHLLLTDEATSSYGFSPAVRFEPPLRPEEHVEALRAALADGTIDCIVSDHRPHHADEKDVQFSVAPPGAVGLEILVSLCLDRLVGEGVVDLGRLVELLSTGPARVFGLNEASGAGSLRPGGVADVTLLDLDREVEVDASGFRSLGRSTPFDGWKLRGAPVGTFVGGHKINLDRDSTQPSSQGS